MNVNQMYLQRHTITMESSQYDASKVRYHSYTHTHTHPNRTWVGRAIVQTKKSRAKNDALAEN